MKNCILGIACITLFSFISSPEIARLYFVRTEMSFNQPDVTTEIYIYTDWDCSTSKELNTKLTTVVEGLKNRAKFIFIDLNPQKYPALTKINEAFLINKNKELTQYIKIRQKLFELKEKNSALTEEAIKSALAAENIDYSLPSDQMLQDGLVFYDTMKKNFQVKQTPTILIYNLNSRKSEKLDGDALLNPLKTIEAFNSLQNKT